MTLPSIVTVGLLIVPWRPKVLWFFPSRSVFSPIPRVAAPDTFGSFMNPVRVAGLNPNPNQPNLLLSPVDYFHKSKIRSALLDAVKSVTLPSFKTQLTFSTRFPANNTGRSKATLPFALSSLGATRRWPAGR